MLDRRVFITGDRIDSGNNKAVDRSLMLLAPGSFPAVAESNAIRLSYGWEVRGGGLGDNLFGLSSVVRPSARQDFLSLPGYCIL